MHSDIDFEYYAHLTTTFDLTLNLSIIVAHGRIKDQYWRACPNICSEQFNPFNSHGKVQPEVTREESLKITTGISIKAWNSQ